MYCVSVECKKCKKSFVRMEIAVKKFQGKTNIVQVDVNG